MKKKNIVISVLALLLIVSGLIVLSNPQIIWGSGIPNTLVNDIDVVDPNTDVTISGAYPTATVFLDVTDYLQQESIQVWFGVNRVTSKADGTGIQYFFPEYRRYHYLPSAGFDGSYIRFQNNWVRDDGITQERIAVKRLLTDDYVFIRNIPTDFEGQDNVDLYWCNTGIVAGDIPDQSNNVVCKPTPDSYGMDAGYLDNGNKLVVDMVTPKTITLGDTYINPVDNKIRFLIRWDNYYGISQTTNNEKIMIEIISDEDPKDADYFRFYKNSCSEITILTSEKTEFDYDTFSECAENIITLTGGGNYHAPAPQVEEIVETITIEELEPETLSIENLQVQAKNVYVFIEEIWYKLLGVFNEV